MQREKIFLFFLFLINEKPRKKADDENDVSMQARVVVIRKNFFLYEEKILLSAKSRHVTILNRTMFFI